MTLYANARTEPMNLRDLDAFLADLDAAGITHTNTLTPGFDLTVCPGSTSNPSQGVVLVPGLPVDNRDFAEWPNRNDFYAIVGRHLVDGEVAVFLWSSTESVNIEISLVDSMGNRLSMYEHGVVDRLTEMFREQTR